MNKKEDKNKTNKHYMIKVREETILAMSEVREKEHFNWSAYLRDCIAEKLNQFVAQK